MIGRALALILMLSGCGIDETKFVPDYTERYCELVFDCSGSATLLFDGLGDLDQCNGQVGPSVERQLEQCESYDGKSAKKCLKEMKDLTCPPEGTALDEVLPAICGEVFVDCTDAQPKGTEPDETDTGVLR